ncbi:hypothetical protein TRFO_14221 [Tritrichomonas foetus]|uniref:Uncharacterized protein n=1 Tax=Tritrichomonas foetus TaxID=1144522 RepID=A0A1J4KWR2_9EUKA|nr:hypothetical protein TRFO_14221 [Tritrichomonas foetus]|eukprot:OHT15312.1 hypothetical protein TRFO_14221 [Tritrichomonas foetus]
MTNFIEYENVCFKFTKFGEYLALTWDYKIQKKIKTHLSKIFPIIKDFCSIVYMDYFVSYHQNMLMHYRYSNDALRETNTDEEELSQIGISLFPNIDSQDENPILESFINDQQTNKDTFDFPFENPFENNVLAHSNFSQNGHPIIFENNPIQDGELNPMNVVIPQIIPLRNTSNISNKYKSRKKRKEKVFLTPYQKNFKISVIKIFTTKNAIPKNYIRNLFNSVADSLDLPQMRRTIHRSIDRFYVQYEKEAGRIIFAMENRFQLLGRDLTKLENQRKKRKGDEFGKIHKENENLNQASEKGTPTICETHIETFNENLSENREFNSSDFEWYGGIE